MPQLVKGGKYVFGWTLLSRDYSIRIPDDTWEEYRFSETRHLILLAGSKTSGGFSINAPASILRSKFSREVVGAIAYRNESDLFGTPPRKKIPFAQRWVAWTDLETANRRFQLGKSFAGSLGFDPG
ncbi:MAG TPA: hypothetical protein PLK12_14015, partial [Prolixibacteraceae bacterium]|nr:hypothetical protein [Prolixibacteraceae bacterium]